MQSAKPSANEMFVAMLNFGKVLVEAENMLGLINATKTEIAYLQVIRDTLAELVRKMDARLVELEQDGM